MLIKYHGFPVSTLEFNKSLSDFLFNDSIFDKFFISDLSSKFNFFSFDKETQMYGYNTTFFAGLDKSEIKIEIVDSYLVLQSNNKSIQQSLKISIPDDLDTNTIKAEYVNGNLAITANKITQIKENNKFIQIS